MLNTQSINQVLEMGSFQSSSFSQAEWEELLIQCPIRALCTCALTVRETHTQPLRNCHSQLFVCFCKAKLGCLVTLVGWCNFLCLCGTEGSSFYRDKSPLNQRCSYLMDCTEGSSLGRHLCCSIMVHTMHIWVNVTCSTPVSTAVLLPSEVWTISSVPHDPFGMSHPIQTVVTFEIGRKLWI